MKGSSKVIMGATMAIVIILAIVIALVLVLLAELYCSLLFRHRKLNKLTKTPSINSQPQLTPQDQSFPSPLSTFYAQGVLLAPRSFLFPKENNNNNNNDDIEKLKHGKLHQFLRVQTHHQIGLTSLSSSSPSPSYVSLTKTHQPNHNNDQVQDKKLDFMYISNPIYDGVLSSDLDPSLVVAGTPFETSDGSPSWADQSPNGSCGDDDEEEEKPGPLSFGSLALSTIKETGEKACNSECNSHIERSSSSSGSLCNSPSW